MTIRLKEFALELVTDGGHGLFAPAAFIHRHPRPMLNFISLPFTIPTFSLPSLALPASIQTRFIAFVLQKSLGHLVKPGQLDSNKITAQLGSGHVEINDVELDERALNESLDGLPVRVRNGVLGSVAVNFPFQNLLTAPLSLSVDRLDLTLVLHKSQHLNTEETKAGEVGEDAVDGLAQSVVSVAQEFINEELDGASLRDSVTLETGVRLPPPPPQELQQQELDDEDDMATHVPGSLDPFGEDPLDMHVRTAIRREGSGIEDVEGVSMLAQMVERVLARLSFTASNIVVRVIHEHKTELVLKVGKIVYGTEEKGASTDGVCAGEKRTVTIQGLEALTRPLVQDAAQSLTGSPDTSKLVQSGSTQIIAPPSPPKPVDLEPQEEEDEGSDEMDASMTQSMVSLPPPPGAASTTLDSDDDDDPSSTMFFSAANSVRAHTPPPLQERDTPLTPPESSPTTPVKPATFSTPVQQHPVSASVSSTLPPLTRILSFGDDPIVLSLITPPPRATSSNEEASSAQTPKETLQLQVKVGVATIGLQTTHINSLLSIADEFKPAGAKRAPPRPPKSQTTSPPFLSNLHASLSVRGIHVYLFELIHDNADVIFERVFGSTLSNIEAPHLRLQLDGISANLTPGPTSPSVVGGLKDLSAFFIHCVPKSSSDAEPSEFWMASPMLIVDHHTTAQYDASAVEIKEPGHSYMVPVQDWTNPASHISAAGRPKISLWRARLPATRQPRAPANLPEAEALEAAIVQVDLDSGSTSVEVAPLHLFLDTVLLSWLLGYIKYLDLPESSNGPASVEVRTTKSTAGQGWKQATTQRASRDAPSPATTPKARLVELPSPDVPSRHRVQDMVIAEFSSAAEEVKDDNTHVRCTLIRVELRTASTEPDRYTKRKLLRQRSGVVVVDIHEPHLTLYKASVEKPTRGQKGRARFDSDKEEKEVLPVKLSVGWRELLAFYAAPSAPKAVAFLCVGCATTQSLQDATSSSGLYSESLVKLRSGTPSNLGSTGADAQAMTSVEVVIPRISCLLEKPPLDGLQLFADDMAQWADRALSPKTASTTTSQATSRAPTLLVGSRYFVDRTASAVEEEQVVQPRSDLTAKLSLGEVFVKLMVPREEAPIRPVELMAAGIETTVQVRPDGKDETVIIATVMDTTLQEMEPDGPRVYLSLTSPRRLFGPSIPMIELRLDSISLVDAKSKQSRVHLTASKFTYTVYPDFSLAQDLARFAKAPPGVFEQVIPSERTILNLDFRDGSIRVIPPNHPGCLILGVEDVFVGTELVNGSADTSVAVTARSLYTLLIDDTAAPLPEGLQTKPINKGLDYWLISGFALILSVNNLQFQLAIISGEEPRTQVDVSNAIVALHLCADTISALVSLAGDLATLAPKSEAPPPTQGGTSIPISGKQGKRSMAASIFLEENAFKRVPELGPEADLIEDDIPRNPGFIDAKFGGARPYDFEEEFGDLETHDHPEGRMSPTGGMPGFVEINSDIGHTIRMLTDEPIKVIEGYFDRLPPETVTNSDRGSSPLSVRVSETKINVHLHSGYDWHRTRKTIEEEVKAIRRRLEKIKQLLANGQAPDDSIEKTNALLFNSVYLGLEGDIEDMDGQDLVAAIDANLAEDFETASQESWQTLPANAPHPPEHTGDTKKRRRRVWGRSKKSEVEIEVQGLNAAIDKFKPEDTVASNILATVRDLKILDHMKTSTWVNFLTSMRTDSRGNKRETDSDMVRVELKMVKPSPNVPDEEARLRAKILPIRLYVDQDALDFLKKFFSFQDSNGFRPPVPPTPQPETYFQRVEVFPVELKLDYKPKRVDYKALKEGKTIELMNFFHFEDAEMTLRHITLTGMVGWARLGDTLNDLWTPDVKANQLADVISGVAPIRSLVNVGTGVADLLLLPIAQYKKDKRLARGIQKGTAAFMKTTAMETIKLGAKLATGTQVILEHAERALGAEGALFDGTPGSHGRTIMGEAMPSPIIRPASAIGGSDGGISAIADALEDSEEIERQAVISRYAAQPEDVKQGVKTAYKSLSRNINAAAQTILAVPMEVYEQSGSGGPVRAVVRAVPIAVIKPMIGASEAVRETLLGLRNTLDPNILQENEDKYKGAA